MLLSDGIFLAFQDFMCVVCCCAMLLVVFENETLKRVDNEICAFRDLKKGGKGVKLLLEGIFHPTQMRKYLSSHQTIQSYTKNKNRCSKMK